MTTVTKIISVATVAGVIALGFALIPDVALGLTGGFQEGVNAARGADVPTTLTGDGGVITTVINTALFIVGFLSVIMLIFGGIRYIISGGNSTAVTAAKNTILYAVVGLIIAIFAYAIVNFVIGSFTGGLNGSGTNV